MLTCPACRSPVDVPANHAAETIRCGICWADVTLDSRTEEEIVEAAEPVAVAAKVDPFRGVPGRTAKGMAPLEDLLRNVAERMPNLFSAVAAPAEDLVIFPAETPRRIERRPGEDDDLRRKRGTASSRRTMFNAKEEVEPPRPQLMSKLMLMLLVALFVMVFVAAYQFLR